MNGNIDVTKLSDEELFKIIGASPEQPQQPQLSQQPDLSRMPEAELMRMAGIPQIPQLPRTTAQYLLPSFLTKYQEKPGERTLLGDIFERPGAAIRSALMGKGYTAGAVMPEKVPSFQETFLKKYYEGMGARKPTLAGVTGGFGVSALGLGADILTNPADMLLTLMPFVPVGAKKTLGQVIAKTKGVQAVKRFMTKERQLRLRSPFFNDNWLKAQAKTIQTVANGMNDVLNSAYDDIYRPFGQLPVDPTKMDDILVNYGVPDAIIKEIEDAGAKYISNVQSAKLVSDILRKRVPQAVWKGVTRPAGGIISPKVIAKNASGAVKQLIYESIGKVDPDASIALKALDTFASQNIYPKISKLSSMVGGRYAVEPSTAGVVGTFRGISEKATERIIIREIPKTLKQFRAYLLTNYRDDITTLYKSSKQLLGAMNAYQRRIMYKKVAKGATILGTGGAGLYGLGRLLRGRSENY